MSDSATEKTLMPRAVHSLIADQAYQAVRDSVSSGRFKPGEQLVEARLAEELGISRGPVREALKRLGQEGLVVHRPHQGTFLRELSAEEVVAIYDVRVALESVSIRLLAKRAEVPEPLEAVASDMRRAAAAGRTRDLIEIGYEFHRRLCDLSGNAFVLEFFNVLAAQLKMALQLDAVEYLRNADVDDYVTSHLELLEAIRAGDEFAAATALEQHVMDGLGVLVERLAPDSQTLDALRGQVLGPAGRVFGEA